MNDQAANLRRLVDKTAGAARQTKVIAVISGKGGVGKSNFALNFCLELTKIEKKVILFDLDIGMANVDILMGVSSKYTIVHMLEQEQLTIWDIIEKGPMDLSYVAGGSGLSSMFQLNPSKLSKFMTQIEMLNEMYDYIIFDMGAGATNDSLQFILSANETILVTTSEPTSITDAYAMLKYIHKLDHTLPCAMIINQTSSEKEGYETANRLQKVALQFLKKDIPLLGIVPSDKAVLKAVMAQTPFVIHNPKSNASKAIHLIARRYCGESQINKPTFSIFINKFRKLFAER
ncbi:MinD/ParA family protein [Anaerobacillus sp. MEB173]|uniref:MinD/ParA family protein n=1 Tax=Anaerobacillus sp. MEB173 TaxID=3383345 RepID=UPI003F8FFCF6